MLLLLLLGTRCTVTHCRIALWSHQSAQTANSERCIMQRVNVSHIYIYIYVCRIVQCALLVTIIMALWQLANLGTQCTVTHCRIAYCEVTRVLKAVSSERCRNANSERFSERLSTQSIRVLNRIYLEHNTYIWISGLDFPKGYRQL